MGWAVPGETLQNMPVLAWDVGCFNRLWLNHNVLSVADSSARSKQPPTLTAAHRRAQARAEEEQEALTVELKEVRGHPCLTVILLSYPLDCLMLQLRLSLLPLPCVVPRPCLQGTSPWHLVDVLVVMSFLVLKVLREALFAKDSVLYMESLCKSMVEQAVLIPVVLLSLLAQWVTYRVARVHPLALLAALLARR